jgi:hypothetical protein
MKRLNINLIQPFAQGRPRTPERDALTALDAFIWSALFQVRHRLGDKAPLAAFCERVQNG